MILVRSFKITQSITDRQDASLGLYFRDVSRVPLLTPEEEVELTTKVKNGDEKAKNKLIESNLRFVISVAKQYQNKGIPLVDLIQDGTLGLIEAASKFEPDKGYKFISYAVWWIRQSIIKAISDQCRTVRLPMSQIVCLNKINKASEKFEQLNGRKPDSLELEDEINIDSSKINGTINSSIRSVSLENPLKDDEVSCLLDIIADEDSEPTDTLINNKDLYDSIERILSKIPYRDRDVLRMSYGIGIPSMTNDEIANKFGIGTERVRQIQHSAINYIRKHYLKELEELL